MLVFCSAAYTSAFMRCMNFAGAPPTPRYEAFPFINISASPCVVSLAVRKPLLLIWRQISGSDLFSRRLKLSLEYANKLMLEMNLWWKTFSLSESDPQSSWKNLSTLGDCEASSRRKGKQKTQTRREMKRWRDNGRINIQLTRVLAEIGLHASRWQ